MYPVCVCVSSSDFEWKTFSEIIISLYVDVVTATVDSAFGNIGGTCKWEKDVSAGPRLNIKTVLSTYGDFHVKDKTAVRTSYL